MGLKVPASPVPLQVMFTDAVSSDKATPGRSVLESCGEGGLDTETPRGPHGQREGLPVASRGDMVVSGAMLGSDTS